MSRARGATGSKSNAPGSSHDTSDTPSKTGTSHSNSSIAGKKDNSKSKDLPADVSAMRVFVEKVNSKTIEDFKRLFKKMQARGAFPEKMTRNAHMQNLTKCRYNNIYCLDNNRVILKPTPPSSGDFIHANWVSSSHLSRKLICAQAPMENTVIDFWRMVWQENVELIIMLCKVLEDGKEKCAPYWPNKEGESKKHGLFNITNTKMQSRDDVTLTVLSVCYGNETRRVRHFQWTSWPDRLPPCHLITPYTLHGISRTAHGPTIVHCSAGIGRSGTFIMLEIVYRCLRAGTTPTSVSSLLWELRSQRASCVQTFDQYLYLYYATIKRLVNRGAVDPSSVANFCTIYEARFKSKTGLIPVQWPPPRRHSLTMRPKRHTKASAENMRRARAKAGKNPNSAEGANKEAYNMSMEPISLGSALSAEPMNDGSANKLEGTAVDGLPTALVVGTLPGDAPQGEAHSPLVRVRSESAVRGYGYVLPEYYLEDGTKNDSHETRGGDIQTIAMDMEKFDVKATLPAHSAGGNMKPHTNLDDEEEHFFTGVGNLPKNTVSVYMPFQMSR